MHKKTPHKIALVSNTTWNIYNFRLNVIDKLIAQGHEVVVIAPVDEYIHYKERYPRITHIPLRKLDRDSINPFKDLRLTMELSAIYRRTRPDFIIHYTVKPNIYGGFAAKLNGIPSVAVVTGLGYAFIHNGMVKKMTKSLYRLASGAHRKFIFENDADRALFEDEHLIRAGQGISVRGCGVDTEFYRPMHELHVQRGKTIFTFIGRLLYDKGVREFIRAAHIVKEKFPDTEFWMVGEIDKENPSAISEDDLVNWIRESDIKYLGSTNDVKNYIAKSDCIVLPSYREGMSRIIMEGMSMEKPIITTDTPGCRETVDDGENGFLVPVGDHIALSHTMMKFYHLDHEKQRRMGIKGRQKAIREFSGDVIADEIYGILNAVF